MKISMEESASQIEPEIIVRCREMDEPLRRVVAAIRLASGMLIGRQEERSYMHPVFRPSYCCFWRFI